MTLPKPPTSKTTAEVKAVQQKTQENSKRFNTAILIFLGSFLGSLIGAAGDLSQLISSSGTIRDFFSPPPSLCIVGSNTILGEGVEMALDWRSEFEKNQRVRLDIQGIGSTAGVERAATGGCAHVLAMSEPITTAHLQRLSGAGIEVECAAPIGYDVIAFVTEINNPVTTVDINQLDDVLEGQITNWREIRGSRYQQPITILARPGSGTTDYVLTNIAAHTSTAAAPFPSGGFYVQCASNGECLDELLSTPGAVYWVSSAWMRTQPEQYLRVLPILEGDTRPINPLEDEVDLQEYPRQLVRPLYMYILRGQASDPAMNDMATQFLKFVRGVRGQEILESHAFYTHFARPTDVDVPLPAGFDHTRGNAGVCKAS
jgi:phosphate transport system substrate-binding protein